MSSSFINCIMNQWLLIAFVSGTFWGVVAFFLYTPWKELNWGTWYEKGQTIFCPAQQFILNFLGGFLGWYFFQLLYERIKNNDPFGGLEVSLLILALLGVSGRLSAVLWGIPESLKELIKSRIKTN